MEVFYLTHSSELKNLESHVMAIGFFDGVHLGHQALFQHAKDKAAEQQMKCSAFTFSPHPDEIIKGDSDRKYLTPLEEKIDKIKKCGVDQLFVMNFDKAFASLPPLDFIEKFIAGMNVKHVVVGFDFTFGFKAEGNTTLLAEESNKGKFGLTVVPKKVYRNSKISSTATRKLVNEGNVEHIPHYLGMNYQIKAIVDDTKSDNNLSVVASDRYMLPKRGMYEVEVVIGNETYSGELRLLRANHELFIYDFNRSHAKEELTIKFLNRLRVKKTVLV